MYFERYLLQLTNIPQFKILVYCTVHFAVPRSKPGDNVIPRFSNILTDNLYFVSNTSSRLHYKNEPESLVKLRQKLSRGIRKQWLPLSQNHKYSIKCSFFFQICP